VGSTVKLKWVGVAASSERWPCKVRFLACVISSKEIITVCEINPKHQAFFKLEAFTSNPNMTQEEFMEEVLNRLLEIEMKLNADGKFRFHIHGEDHQR
jgi:hypothetical protein